MNAAVFHFTSMGCPCALHVETSVPDLARRALDRVRRECERLDHKYSHYRDDGLLATMQARPGTTFEVDGETADLLDFAAALYRQSGGRFDITSGALTRLWQPPRTRLPEPGEIAAALACTGWRHLDWRRPHLRLKTPGVRLNMGGLVKEYAADRCAQVCREAGVHAGLVDLGGDLAIIGPHADGTPWLAGIRWPEAAGQARAGIALEAGGLATSGDYERVLVIDGRRYSHIVNPRSGWPVSGLASVSVLADSCLVAGAAATLAMLLGAVEGIAYLRGLGLPFMSIAANGHIEHAGGAQCAEEAPSLDTE